eukprot:GHRQ01029823.1.p2 GENE.GHRQ01029823.1~~GHRQ01029823.1.p2  ORF type:complete len:121 (-),score=38.62 GHRQ01029823.1:412-774(-)
MQQAVCEVSNYAQQTLKGESSLGRCSAVLSMRRSAAHLQVLVVARQPAVLLTELDQQSLCLTQPPQQLHVVDGAAAAAHAGSVPHSIGPQVCMSSQQGCERTLGQMLCMSNCRHLWITTL